MSAYDEIAAGLVDSQIESIEVRGDCLCFVTNAGRGFMRAWWQCAIVTAVAADLEPALIRRWSFSYIATEGPRWDGETAVHLHHRGPLEAAPEDEVRARLEERAEIAELVFHRPLDRVAVELRAVVDTRPPNSGWDVIRNVPTGEGHYYELFDRTGHRLSYGGHSARMLSGGGSADGRTGVLG